MSLEQRTHSLEAMADGRLDLLVIGGGIVGAGVARDAAMRCIRTGLVEQYDFAAGTSSRSSRLLHGGIRYLAQGDIRLVREASVEKRVLATIAPHLASPLAFVFPTFSDQRDWRLWQLKIGVKLYDALCGWRNLGDSQWLSREQVSGMLPGIRQDELAGAVRYYDGLTNDARLVIDTLRSAERHGAFLANHVRFEKAERQGDSWQCELSDVISGKTITVRTRWLITAAGAWSDRVPNSTLPMRLTKGVHLVIPGERLPVKDAVVMTERKRVLFAIPWGKRTILGTTDTDLVGRVEDVRCERGDIEYILSIVNRNFPAADISEADVLSTWAGVRPLVAQAGQPSEVSRSHEIRKVQQDWLEIGGGKLTTYRLIAQEAVDRVAPAILGARGDCRTAQEALVSPAEAEGISTTIPPAVSEFAVQHYCRNEWALHLEDVMLRRSSWHYYEDEPAQIAEQVSGWMAKALGWDAETAAKERAAYGVHATMV